MEPVADEPLAAFLSKVRGVSCVLPFERLRDLTGCIGGCPSPKFATWWTDPAGWRARPAARACEAAGWGRLESVQVAAELVRFMRTAGVDEASTA